MCSAHSLYSYTDCTRYNLTTLLSPLPRLVTVESVNITLFSCQAINLAGFFFTFCSVRRRHTSIFISIMETGPSLCLRQDACCVLILFVTRVEEAGENRVRKGHERFDLSVPRDK